MKENEFRFFPGDRVKILTVSGKNYTGQMADIEEGGFWVVLDEDPEREEFFAFVEVEKVQEI